MKQISYIVMSSFIQKVFILTLNWYIYIRLETENESVHEEYEKSENHTKLALNRTMELALKINVLEETKKHLEEQTNAQSEAIQELEAEVGRNKTAEENTAMFITKQESEFAIKVSMLSIRYGGWSNVYTCCCFWLVTHVVKEIAVTHNNMLD